LSDSNTSATLTTSEQWLARLGIRPEEKSVTTLLFGNMFMSGIAIGMIRVCALTLFLEHFGSEQLALIAILLAVVGMPITIIIDRLTHRLSLRTYLFAILGTVMGGLIVFRLLLGVTDSTMLIFALPLFFEVVYMLFSLQFIALLTRLLNVRQSKRLSGIARSGEFMAAMAGGMLIILLLNFLSVQDLLLVAIGATGVVFAIVQFTVSHFRSNLVYTNEDWSETDINETRMFGMLKLSYVKLIALCYATYMFAYFFIDVAFYKYATVQFPDERQLAQFIAQFFAISGLLTMFSMVFLFGPILRRFGVMFGVLAFPVLIFAGSSTVSAMEFYGMEASVIFAVMVVTNAMRFILQSSIWKPTVTILFQVLPDRQRTQGTSFIEGVVDPLAGGVAGVCLYVLSDILNWDPQYFLMVLSGLMLCWIGMSFFIRKLYLTSLVISIQKRKLGEMSIDELDNASLDIIKTGIDSPYPAEVFYCLNLLEEIEHPEITELIKRVISNSNREVRMDVLRRIAAMKITPLRERVLERIEQETDPGVRGQAMITYSELEAEDTVQVLTPYLEAFHHDLRQGALIGILCTDPHNDMANDFLLAAVRSTTPSDRIFAGDVMGEIGLGHFSGYLVELLDDMDNEVVEHAIFAAGRIRDNRIVNLLIGKLASNALQPHAVNALRQFDETALFDLDIGLTSPEATRQVKLHIIEVIGDIGGIHAIEILLRHIDIKQPELRHQVYLGLAALHYQADPDDQYIFVNKIDEEVQLITALLASMEDIVGAPDFQLLHNALGNELDVRRDNMLLLISFLFPSIVMLDTRANIDSKVTELRSFALEVLDNLLTGEIKQIVLPLLDDLTVAEQLEMLAPKFPQARMSPEERFREIVETHYAEAFSWTRSCLLYLIGQQKAEEHAAVVMAAMNDKEAIIRETCAWSITRLNPSGLRRTLTAHAGDENISVRQTIAELLSGLPPPEPEPG
jgi:ATP:ADP antiporter, AAA family